VVTRPFTFEGGAAPPRRSPASPASREEVDTLIVIPNDRLLSITRPATVSVLDAFHSADQVLLSGVQGITDLITTPGLINLDFADVKSVDAGRRQRADGHRLGARARTARSRPPRRRSPRRCSRPASTARTACCCRSRAARTSACSRSNEAAPTRPGGAPPEATLYFGAVIDDALGDEVRVTVIAAGFDGGAPARRRDDRALGQVSGRTVTPTRPPAAAAPTPPVPAAGSGAVTVPAAPAQTVTVTAAPPVVGRASPAGAGTSDLEPRPVERPAEPVVDPVLAACGWSSCRQSPRAAPGTPSGDPRRRRA
jgi:cell division protein FtsZ